MSTQGEYTPTIPGVYKVAFARHDDAHIGPTYKTRAEARACTAPLDRRINRRGVWSLGETRYILSKNTAIILVKASKNETCRRPPRATLTDEQVREIRRLVESGLKQSVIAKRFKLSRTSVSSLIRGETYKWVK